ncbi:hypothetical protein DEU56DRAFT_918555 [Suillus clintonianus]|uniref:uncharacterized protein n=1 Tax=Suillus clintonianus TaxID=1904413 RepID=UPI001B870A7B|nr:uncharacterized protein DEU56DRAFT_918555 [Suillus clintonianus]KAG2119388.1 hypothetical protein DEU56DRAFT_918555 [Suillus clintonianus]
MTFPDAGVYLIQNSSNPDIYATIHGTEHVLRAESLDVHKYYQRWRVTYADNDSDQGICVLSKEQGAGILGVRSSVHQNAPVFTLSESQSWILTQTDEGYTIGQFSQHGVYNWSYHTKGEPITVVENGQSWKFVPEN